MKDKTENASMNLIAAWKPGDDVFFAGKKRLEDAQQTEEFGMQLGKQLAAGDLLALEGNLGAGKTHLTRAILQSLHEPQHENPASSPTYTLVQEYDGTSFPVAHFDFYRCESALELLELGWDEYVEGDWLVLVEWPNLFPELLPEKTRWLKIEHDDQGQGRVIHWLDVQP